MIIIIKCYIKVCSLEYNNLLEKACEERGQKLIEEQKYYNIKELSEFLSNFGRNYFIECIDDCCYKYVPN